MKVERLPLGLTNFRQKSLVGQTRFSTDERVNKSVDILYQDERTEFFFVEMTRMQRRGESFEKNLEMSNNLQKVVKDKVRRYQLDI